MSFAFARRRGGSRLSMQLLSVVVLGAVLAACSTRLNARPSPTALAEQAAHAATAPLPADDTDWRTHAASDATHASYRLSVTLDPKTHTLTGNGTIRLKNGSRAALHEVYLHLYLNAFKHTDDDARTALLSARQNDSAAATPGQTDVQAFTDTRTGRDLWAAAEFVGKSGAFNETDVRIPLSEPLPAGESADFTVVWRSSLPGLTERTGYVEDYYFIAQWFPKLAKLQDDGTFAHFSFDPRGEFYADFGEYDVEMTVPASYVVGATGSLVSSETLARDLKRVRYRAESVHDFAWTAWPGYLEATRRFGATDVRMLFPADYHAVVERTFEAIEFGLAHFTQAYGPYPYPSLTVVHPPSLAAGASGMEYPTLFTTGGAWHATLNTPVFHGRAIELVTLHELAHQWFYGMLASNEMQWPFLDEGLASFAETAAAEAWLGEHSFRRWFAFSFSATTKQRLGGADASMNFPIAQPADAFPRFTDIGAVVYGRTATLFETLRRVYGPALDQSLRAYARKFRFRHPDPSDLLDSISQGLGPDVAEQTKKALFERGWVDYQILNVESARRGRVLATAQGNTYYNRITVARQGTLSFPVQIEWKDEAGGSFEQAWDGLAPFTTVEFESSSPLAQASVDGRNRILLDQNLLNNVLTVERKASLLGLETWAFLLATALHVVGP